MFGIYKGTHTAHFLLLCNAMQRQRCLARAFRTVNFNDPPHGQAADTQCDIKAQRPGRT